MLGKTRGVGNGQTTDKMEPHLASQVAPGPSVDVKPGALVWINVAPFPFSSIFSKSITRVAGSCFVYAKIFAPNKAMI